MSALICEKHGSTTTSTGPLRHACGFLCALLPDDVRHVLVEEVVTPVSTVALNLVFCVMGPVILVSMITAVSALKSVDDLTSMGVRLVGRFAKCILSVMFVGIAVSLLFFSVFGEGGVDIKVKDLVNLLLDVFPKDPVSPIKEGNTPQLVILGLVLGAALIIPGNEVRGLRKVVSQAGTWVMTVMDLVQVVLPIIPFCSVFIAMASDSSDSLLEGWQFVAAMFLACTVCGAVKFFHVARKYRIAPAVLWGKLKPLVGFRGAVFGLRAAHHELQRGVRRAADGPGGHRIGRRLRRHRPGARQAGGVSWQAARHRSKRFPM